MGSGCSCGKSGDGRTVETDTRQIAKQNRRRARREKKRRARAGSDEFEGHSTTSTDTGSLLSHTQSTKKSGIILWLRDEDAEKFTEGDLEIIQQFKNAIDDDNHALAEMWISDSEALNLQKMIWKCDRRSGDAFAKHLRTAIVSESGGTEKAKEVYVTTLMYCFMLNKTDTVNWMLSESNPYNLDVDYRRSTDGRSVLHLMVETNSPIAWLSALIAKKANRELKDFRDESPIDICREKEYLHMMPILKPGFKMTSSPFDEDLDDLLEMVGGAESTTRMTASMSYAGSTTFTSASLSMDTDVDIGSERMMMMTSESVTGMAIVPEGETVVTTKPTPVEDLGKEFHMRAAHLYFTQAEVTDIEATRSLVTVLSHRIVVRTDSKNPFNRRVKKSDGIDKAKMNLMVVGFERSKLPKLYGWLEKKSPAPPYGFQRRWVVCTDGYILWSSKQTEIINANDEVERKNWTGHFDLFHMRDVKAKLGKSKPKFLLTGTDPRKKKTREYVWRCTNASHRDQWVAGINAHRKFLDDMVTWLGKDE